MSSPRPTAHNRSGIVIGWMPFSQRSTTLASRLGFKLLLLGRPGFRRPWTAPFAYPVLAARSVMALLRLRPSVVVIVAPPVMAPLTLLPVAAMLRARVAIDIHSGALLDRRWGWSVPVLRWLCRAATVSIVTLDMLARRLGPGVHALVLPDPLPELIPTALSAENHDGATVVAICGWGDDEPIAELIRSADGRNWHMTITGHPRRHIPTPANVRLAGFLRYQDYVDLLARADVVVALTVRDETLLSGAWEAVALGRPLVLSDTHALRMAFGEAARYVAADAASIAAGIEDVFSDRTASAARIERLRERLSLESDRRLAALRSAVEG